MNAIFLQIVGAVMLVLLALLALVIAAGLVAMAIRETYQRITHHAVMSAYRQWGDQVERQLSAYGLDPRTRGFVRELAAQHSRGERHPDLQAAFEAGVREVNSHARANRAQSVTSEVPSWPTKN